MAISGHRSETSDAAGLNKIIDLSALHIRRTVISSWENSVTGFGPRLARSLRQVLQIGAHVKSGGRIAPNLPSRFRVAKAFQKPGPLLSTKNGLRGLVLAEICDLHPPEADRGRRPTAIVGSPPIQDFHSTFRNELRKVIARKRFCLGLIGRLLGTIGALIGDDELDVAAPPQRAVALEAADGGQIVRFLTQAVFIKPSHGRIHNLRRIEPFQRRPARFRDSRRLIFEKRLIGRHFAGLRRKRFSFKSL